MVALVRAALCALIALTCAVGMAAPAARAQPAPRVAGPPSRSQVELLFTRALALQDDSTLRLDERRRRALQLVEAAEAVALRLGDFELADSLWTRWADVHLQFTPDREVLQAGYLAMVRCESDVQRAPAARAPDIRWRCDAQERAREAQMDAMGRRVLTATLALRRAFLHRAAAHFRAAGQPAKEAQAWQRLAMFAGADGSPEARRAGDYTRRAAEAQARTRDPEQEGAALVTLAVNLDADSVPADSIARLYRRAAERFTVAGAHDRAADARMRASALPSGAAGPDSAAAVYARARDAYLRAGDTVLAARMDTMRLAVTGPERMFAPFAPDAPEALVDSAARACAAAGVDSSGMCTLLRYTKLSRQMARGEFDAARATARDVAAGGDRLAGSLGGIGVAGVEALIGHPYAAADNWRMLLAPLTDEAFDAVSPLGLTPAEARALRATRAPLDAARLLAAPQRRASAAGTPEVARLAALLRASLLSTGGRPDEAERVLQEALAGPPRRSPHDASVHLTLSGLLERRGALREALASARAAVRELTPNARGSRPTRGSADPQEGGGLLPTALATLARLAAHAPESAGEARVALARADSLRAASVVERQNVWSRLQGHVRTAETLQQLARWARGGAAREALLDTAHAHFDSAAASAAVVRARLRAERDAVAWADQWAALHDGWTALWAGRAAAGAPNDRAALVALGIAELGRAQALRDLLGRGAPPGGPLGSAGLAALADDSSESRVRRAPAAFAAGLLAAARRPNTALLYLHHTQGGETFAWLAGPGEGVRLLPAVRRAPGWAERQVAAVGRGMRLAFARTDTLTGARADSVDAWKDAAAAALDSLGALLPHDALAALPDGTELVVVPHGVLGQVPFAALRVRAGAARPYLLTRFAVRQAPSLAALAAAEAAPVRLSREAPGAPGALVAAWPGAGAPLLRAAAERDSVARLLGARALPTDSASERRVWAALFAAPAVHVAAHARASADARWVRDSTGVWLRSDPGTPPANGQDRAGDGFLSMGELLDAAAGRRLTAELVVLSGCETGAGQASRSEGTIGLQRALLAAGARSVLTSLWVVDDAATASLMADFWRHWLRDADRPTKAEALRRAQLAMSRTAPAYYWAAFQVAGAR